MRKLTIIMVSVAISLFGASLAFADVAPGMQQEGVSLFEQMDQDSDGVVSESEFEQYSMKEQDKTEIFTVIDQDGDKTITATEWQSYREGSAMQPRAAEEPAMEQPMEQPMSPEEKSAVEDEELQERAYGPGVENQQRDILEDKMTGSGDQ